MNDDQTQVAECRQWLSEHGAAYRAETVQAMIDGNDVAMHWAAKVLASLDYIEALVAELDRRSPSRPMERFNIRIHSESCDSGMCPCYQAAL